MKTPCILTSGFLLGFATLMPAAGQEPVEHRIRAADISYQMQQTPQFAVTGPKAKSLTRPREWLEIEVELQLETVDPTGYIDEMDIEYFVAVTDGNTRRTVLLTDTLGYLEVNAGERRVYASAYISPASLAKITGKNRPDRNDITAVAAVISAPGLREPAVVTTGGPDGWWKAEKLARVRGMVLPKSQTPFALLWSDRYPRDADYKVITPERKLPEPAAE